MIFREAEIRDIKQMQVVRNLVKENVLSDPALVSDADCEEYIRQRGKGWVCEIDNQIIGFAIIDMKENSVWALFLHPDFEKKGIGSRLHNDMLNWYFSQTDTVLWLTTAPETRAETFYKNAGYTAVGFNKNGEIRFEIAKNEWLKK